MVSQQVWRSLPTDAWSAASPTAVLVAVPDDCPTAVLMAVLPLRLPAPTPLEPWIALGAQPWGPYLEALAPHGTPFKRFLGSF